MKQEKISKIIVCALVSTIIAGSIPLQNNQVFASVKSIESNQQDLTIDELTTGKTNVVILDANLNHTEYTYEKDGKLYKAIETLNDSFTKGSTKIFQKNNDNTYDLICTSLLSVNDESINLKTTVNGQSVNEEFKLEDLVKDFKTDRTINLETNQKTQLFSTRSSSLTGYWDFATEYSSSTRIKRYTTTFVTAALTAVLSYYFGASAAATAGISGLGGVVGQVVSDEIPLVYYDQNVFYKYALNTDPPLPRAEKTDTWFFSDKARKNSISGKVTCEYYVPGWS